MADVPDARPAAEELVTRIIMPNIRLTKNVDVTSSLYWRYAIYHCVDVYHTLNQRDKEHECLDLMARESDKQDLRDQACFLRANMYADDGDYKTAVSMIYKVRGNSTWALERPKLVQEWIKLQNQPARKSGSKTKAK